jgi:hypothetical protein
MFRRKRSGPAPWALAAGAAAGAGLLAFAVARGVRLLRGREQDIGVSLPAELESLENAAVETLRRDRETGECAIDVAVIAPGIIELSGTVPNHAVGQRATRLLHALSGVNTVISRLEVGSLEERLAAARSRNRDGSPQSRDRQWYGVRVGMGRRRQGDTEPDRDDDSTHRKTRDLEVDPTEVRDAEQRHSATGND